MKSFVKNSRIPFFVLFICFIGSQVVRADTTVTFEDGAFGKVLTEITGSGNDNLILPEFKDRLKNNFSAFPSFTGGLAVTAGSSVGEVFAMGRPWFRGWYTRITKEGGTGSIAVVGASQYLKGMTMPSTATLPGYLAVIIDDNGKTRIYEIFPEKTSFRSSRGKVLDDSQSPDWEEFLWEAECCGTITNEHIDISIPGSVKVNAAFGPRVPWNHGTQWLGPEGMVEFLPFVPLHWFVYSLGSEAVFTFADENGGMSGGHGFAHQEANWGTHFPPAWVWAEGVTADNARQFALSGGQLMFGDKSLTSWLVGYHSPVIQWQFGPGTPYVLYTTSIDACAGYFSIAATDKLRKLVITAKAPAESFFRVSVPTEKGFMPAGSESFSAEVTVSGYIKFPWFGYFKIDHAIFSDAALEFGAGYNCGQ